MKKGKLTKKIMAVMLCCSLCSTPVYAADTGLAPNVTKEMCSAEYWISRTPNAYDVILSKEEIQGLNRRIMDTKETHVKDLSAMESTFNGTKMVADLAAFKNPSNLYLAGQPVPDWYYDYIRTNISTSRVSSTMTLQYGFVVNQTVMKGYPYNEYLSDTDWDMEWDNEASTGLNVNEPVVVYFYSGDGQFAYVESSFCSGWVPALDVAVCKNKKEWQKVQSTEDVLVVTGEKIYLEPSAIDPSLSEKQLLMGTVLPLANDQEGAITARLSWNNYVVLMPVRNADGSFAQKRALIPANRDVHVGYLPYTTANVLTQAFKALGNRYGWGGMLYSNDCSGYMQNLYRCFGIKLPRNTTWQAAIPGMVLTSLDQYSAEQKGTLLGSSIRPGSILQFRGHEMMYLGCVDGKYYTINDVSSLVVPADQDADIEVIRPRSVIVNEMSTRRGSGVTWLDAMDKIIIIG